MPAGLSPGEQDSASLGYLARLGMTVSPLDVEMANYFYSTHPGVPFTNQLMCMLKTPGG